MKNKYISRKISVFHERLAPEKGTLVGYGAIIEAYRLQIPIPEILTIISDKKRKYKKEDWQVLTSRHLPEDTLYAQLVFALKYEGINLLALKKLFEKITKAEAEKVSILDDVDFELELLHRDVINVAYILHLLIKLKNASESEKDRQRKQIEELLSGEVKLRSKRELIQRFIEENLPHIDDTDTITDEFEAFWKLEQKKAFDRICLEEKVNPDKLFKLIDDYIFSEQIPLRDDIVRMMEEKPKLLERATITERIINKIVEFVDVFIYGMGE